mgnify:CR=1 FL=1
MIKKTTKIPCSVVFWFICLCFLCPGNLLATVKPPVHLKLESAWKAQKGGPQIQVAQEGEIVQVEIVISSGIDVEIADFSLHLPAGWELVEGPKKWQGQLQKHEEIKLQAKVRATADQVGVIKGKLSLPELGTTIYGDLDLRDPERTDRIPEAGSTSPVPPDANIIRMDQGLPEVDNEFLHLLPEKDIEILDRESEIKKLGATDAVPDSCTVRAKGKMVYRDDHGNYIGISGARVILWDSDDDWDDECGRGITAWDGSFDITGSCGDPFGGNPDIYIQLYAINSNYVKVGDPYTCVNPTINGFCGTYDYGTRQVPEGQRGAFQLYNQGVQANKYIDIYDSQPPMVKTNWPASGSGAWYNGEIYITDTTPWFEPQFYHEYGHFIMDKYAVIPSFNYCNGICDASATDCGHCLWDPEDGYIHFMEGWPDFFADLQSDYWNRDNFYGFETHSSHTDIYPVWQRDEIEGMTAAILWDIYDSASDNQHSDLPRDNLSLGFNEIWNVATNYDPGGPYDYPQTIHEFWDGFYGLYPAYRQGLWSVYAEHHINKDTAPPTNPSVSSSHPAYTWSNDRTIAFSWSGATDNLSGVHGYSHYTSKSGSSLPDRIVDTTGTTYTTPSLSDGSGYYFHIRTMDKASNWNSAAVHRGPYHIDGTAPTGTILINSGAVYTKSRNVTLNLSAYDTTSFISRMRFGNYLETWSAWEAYGISKDWTLKDIDGERRVYVQYRDAALNISNQYYDTIVLDRAAPTGSVVINSGADCTSSRTVTLTLSASDATSFVSKMRFGNFGETWSPWETYGTSKTWTLKDSDGDRRVYVQFLDGASNVSLQYYDAIILDRTPPTGDILINNGDPFTDSTSVVLTLSALDSHSGLSRMRFNNDGGTWSGWTPYASSKSWELSSDYGLKTVFVQYKDNAGNISPSFNDKINFSEYGMGGILPAIMLLLLEDE